MSRDTLVDNSLPFALFGDTVAKPPPPPLPKECHVSFEWPLRITQRYATFYKKSIVLLSFIY